MEYNDDLYISTTDTKEVYKQLNENPNMQIVAWKPGTREWVRINGVAKECTEIEIKAKMLEELLIEDVKGAGHKRDKNPNMPHK